MAFVQPFLSTLQTSDDGSTSYSHLAGSAPPALQSPGRVSWIDYAKGIAIALVVLGHVNLGIVSAGLADETSKQYLSAIDDFLYTFHMPVFFFVGGLFAARLRTRPAANTAVILARTIVYPYFVWSLIQGLLGLCFRSYTNHTTAVRDLAMIAVNPPMQFWFLYVYFLIVAMYVLLFKVRIPRAGIALIFVAAWTLMAFGVQSTWTPLFLLQIYAIYFVAGDFARPFLLSALGEQSPLRSWWIPTGIACFVAIGLFAWLAELSIQPLSGLLGIMGTCCIAASLATTKLIRFVKVCGILSLEIYVMHTLFSAAVRIGLTRVFGITNVPIHVALGVLAGIALPATIAYLARRYEFEWLFRFPAPSRLAENASERQRRAKTHA
jgi:fucose 4-O-acetylase-like acetyltransferase